MGARGGPSVSAPQPPAGMVPVTLVGFDLETTGVDPQTARIVTASVLPGASLLVNPGIPIPPDATAIHGVTDAHAAAGMDYRDAVLAIGDALSAAWDSGGVIVGHNVAEYDLPLLYASERLVWGRQRTRPGPVFDTMRAYQSYAPGRRYRLVDMCADLGVPLLAAHNCGVDAAAAAACARIMLTTPPRTTASPYVQTARGPVDGAPAAAAAGNPFAGL